MNKSMAGGVTGGADGTWSDRFEQGLHPFIEVFNASIGFDLTLLGGFGWVDCPCTDARFLRGDQR